MKLRLTERLRRSYKSAPPLVRKGFDFVIQGDEYVILGMTPHPK